MWMPGIWIVGLVDGEKQEMQHATLIDHGKLSTITDLGNNYD